MNLIAVDLGNRYLETASEIGESEMIVSYKEISETDYNNFVESSKTQERVKYKGKYYIIGDKGEFGIDNTNKGHEDVKEISRMFKLVAVAKDMREREVTEMNYKAISGTPIEDYDKFKAQYIELLKSGNEFEVIELDKVEYKIKIVQAQVTKQSAAVLFTLPERKEKNYLLFDFGGGTLDLCYAENGTIVKYKTINFSLNELYVQLAQALSDLGMDIDRGSKNNARFQKQMEKLKLTGVYKGITSFDVDGRNISLSEFVSNWFKEKVDKVILESLYELNLNDSDVNDLTSVFIGGGAKLLEKELMENKKLRYKMMTQKPEFRNVLAYYEIGKIIDNWE